MASVGYVIFPNVSLTVSHFIMQLLTKTICSSFNWTGLFSLSVFSCILSPVILFGAHEHATYLFEQIDCPTVDHGHLFHYVRDSRAFYVFQAISVGVLINNRLLVAFTA